MLNYINPWHSLSDFKNFHCGIEENLPSPTNLLPFHASSFQLTIQGSLLVALVVLPLVVDKRLNTYAV
jgi:hypothetical protein